MSEEKKKSLFERAIDALTDRDEKEAAAKAAAERTAAAQAEADRTAAERAEAARAAAIRAPGDRATAERPAAARTMADPDVPERVVAETSAPGPTKGIVTVRSLRIRADHSTTSEVVGGLVKGNEVTILSTWSDGKDTWARLEEGWAAMIYDGEMYIKTT